MSQIDPGRPTLHRGERLTSSDGTLHLAVEPARLALYHRDREAWTVALPAGAVSIGMRDGRLVGLAQNGRTVHTFGGGRNGIRFRLFDNGDLIVLRRGDHRTLFRFRGSIAGASMWRGWDEFVAAYDRGVCATSDQVYQTIRGIIDRAHAVSSDTDNGTSRDDYARFFSARLREYEHIAPGVFQGDGADYDFFDVHGAVQADQFYRSDPGTTLVRGGRPGCRGVPPARLLGPRHPTFRATFARGLCADLNPFVCRDLVLGQGMPVGAVGDRVTCRFAVKRGKMTAAQAEALVRCRDGRCFQQDGTSMRDTTVLNRAMASYCTGGWDPAPCLVDPKTAQRPETCPNAVRAGTPAAACRAWQKDATGGGGGPAADAAFVKLCDDPAQVPEPWCDCVAGASPGSRQHNLYRAIAAQPVARQSDACWFAPCARSATHALQRTSHVATDPATCQVSCSNIVNIQDSSNVSLSDIAQSLGCTNISMVSQPEQQPPPTPEPQPHPPGEMPDVAALPKLFHAPPPAPPMPPRVQVAARPTPIWPLVAGAGLLLAILLLLRR